MRVRIRRIAEKEKEQVVIECVEVTSQVEDIYAYAKAKGEEICGILTCTIPEEERNRQIERLALDAILYFEAVDDKVFAYTKEKEYEVRIRLYEIEKNYRSSYFVRCSKSVVLNLMQLEGISPALNGRFYAHMKNGEKLVISRQYAPALKEIVMG